ncbi:hypothetical protein SDC9_193342 [bioreactor metagenome]|uniref:Uncharacterized protein n=1 Tax=bioreactor metagenome TaxID=1076179 RepID=A0A645I3B3_9ZZZZ
MNLPSLSPISIRLTSLHKSIKLLGAGVPVSPIILLTFGLTFLRALNLLAVEDLKLESSSMTTISKSNL